jgi:hypothetical protein
MMGEMVSSRTVGKVMSVAFYLMIGMRIVFFILLGWGLREVVAQNWKLASLMFLVSSILGGIIEPAASGAYHAASKEIDRQMKEADKMEDQ